MSLFLVLANFNAPWFLVFLKKPRYDTEWEVLCHIRDEHLYRRWLRTKGGISTSLPWVSEKVWQGYGTEGIHEVEVCFGYRVTQFIQRAEVVLESG